MGSSQLPWLRDEPESGVSGEANPATIFTSSESLRIRWLFKTLEDYLRGDNEVLSYLNMLAQVVLPKIKQ